MRKGVAILLIVIVVVGIGLALNQPPQLPIESEAESQESVNNWEDPVVLAIQGVGPATVKIETVTEVVIDQFFFQYVDQQQGIGSGVIFREDGHILTNNHVVAQSDQINVRLPDGRSYEAKIVGTDPLSDLAMIKITGSDLPTAPLGDSNELRVGEQVVAIGNPFGQDYSVSSGVVSALNRDLLIDPDENRYLEGMIQTDTAINPGNSGGPLLGLNGKVIGINTAIIQNAQGIGFAIPITTAKLTAEQIIEHGKPLKLGVLGGSLVPALAETIRNQTDATVAVERGAFITRVIADSPAAMAGVKPGDIIVAVNSQQIAGMRELRDLVQQSGFGSSLVLDYYRGSNQNQVTVQL